MLLMGERRGGVGEGSIGDKNGGIFEGNIRVCEGGLLKLFPVVGLETVAFGGLGRGNESRGCHTLLGKYLVAFLGPLSSCTAGRKVKSCRKCGKKNLTGRIHPGLKAFPQPACWAPVTPGLVHHAVTTPSCQYY